MTPITVATVAALLSGAAGLWRLGRLPEPSPDPDGPSKWVKPRYSTLVTPLVVTALLMVAVALAVGVAFQSIDAGLALSWGALAGLGSVAAWCDARTTYLPNRLIYPLAGWVTVGLAWHVWLARSSSTPIAATIVAPLACAGGAWLFFWLLWRLGAGIGFGDVRLVAILGALTGAMSPATWLASLLCGSVLGALVGLATAMYRRRHPSALGSAFAYGPSLIAGAWIVVLLSP